MGKSKMGKKFLPDNDYLPHGPWGNLPVGERKEIIEGVWNRMGNREKRALQKIATHMGVRSLGSQSALSLIVSLWLDERTRYLLKKGLFGRDTVKSKKEE